MDKNKDISHIHINGGFPPIKYCQKQNIDPKNKLSKERTFTTIPKKNINIRQLLANKNKKPIIIQEEEEDNIEIVEL
jgi:hypothetical protein